MPAGRILLKSISESKKLALLKTDGARLLYTWLIPHVDVNGCFSGDLEVIKGQIFTRLRKTGREIETYLIDLQFVGLVVRYETNGDQFIFLPSFEEKQPYLNKTREATPRIPTPTPDQIKTNSGVSLDKLPLKLKVKEKVKEKGETAPLISSVIEYLNQKTGKHFSATSAAAVKHINARISEGRTLDDFKQVIDVKAATWKGDPKMDAYLRPETLFGSKMEAYLNESIIPAKGSELDREKRVGGSIRPPDPAAVKALQDRRAMREKLWRVRKTELDAAIAKGDRTAGERINAEIDQAVVDHFRQEEQP